MKLRYVGPFDEVEIPDLGVTVPHGGTFEAAGEAASSLLAQADNFKRVPPPKPPKKTTAAKAPAAKDEE